MMNSRCEAAAKTAILLLISALVPLRAHEPQTGATLARATGAVSIRHGDDGAWIAAAAGSPLAPGDRIATGPRGEADVQLDDANIFDLGSSAEIRLHQLESGVYRLTVVKGSITCHVAGTSQADVEVETPSVAVRTVNPGVYLIGVSQAGASEITVRAGSAEVLAPRGSEWVNAGQKMVARGPASDPVYKIGSAISFWRRLATIMAASVQIASSMGSGGSTSSDDSASSSTTSSAGSSKPATSAPAGASSVGRAPSSGPQVSSSSRGK